MYAEIVARIVDVSLLVISFGGGPRGFHSVWRMCAWETGYIRLLRDGLGLFVRNGVIFGFWFCCRGGGKRGRCFFLRLCVGSVFLGLCSCWSGQSDQMGLFLFSIRICLSLLVVCSFVFVGHFWLFSSLSVDCSFGRLVVLLT